MIADESWLEAQSTEALIALALPLPDDEFDENGNWLRATSRWNIISVLHRRGTLEVFEAAKLLCAGLDPNERRMAADILGQLGYDHKYPFKDETLPILVQLIETDQSVEVLHSACTAFGHLHDTRAIPALLTLKNYPNDNVRFSVVFGLLALEDDRAINALIEL